MMNYDIPAVEIVFFTREDILTASMGDNDVTMGPEK